MFFRRKQKVPIEQAVSLVQQAVEIAYTYKRNKCCYPTDADFELFERLRKTLWEGHCTIQYISRCLKQRSSGTLEGGEKSTNAEISNYHHLL